MCYWFTKKSYALILIRTTADVHLIASLKLNTNKVEGDHRIISNLEKQLYRCYFAPVNTGKHKTTIYWQGSIQILT